MRSIALLVVSAAVVGQTAGDRYMGVWTAEHGGHVYVRVEISATAGAVAGQMTVANEIEVGAQGEVKAVSETLQDVRPIFDVRLTDAGLSFSRKDGDGSDRFEMHLTGNNTSELSLVLSDADRQEASDAGVLTMKPFRLERRAR